MALGFRTINPVDDRDILIRFRTDVYAINFATYHFNQEEYLTQISTQVEKIPEGFVMAVTDHEIVGQVEVELVEWNKKRLGHLILLYLAPEFRGRQYGDELLEYAESVFMRQMVSAYYLFVSPENSSALSFYTRHKIGNLDIGPEVHHGRLRLGRYLC